MYAREQHLWWYRGMRAISEAMIEATSPPWPTGEGRGLEVLDAGCGTGAGLEWLARYGRVTGIDLSDTALAYCRERGLPRLVRGSIEDLPFADASFDLITTFDVLYHRWVGDDLQALRELRRVLRPAGRLLVRVPAFASLAGRHDVAVYTRQRYRRCELVARLRAVGFDVERATYVNALLLPLVVGKRIAERWTREAPSDLDATPDWLNRAFTQILRLEAALVRHRALPCGVSVMALARC